MKYLQQYVHVLPICYYIRLTREPKEGSMMYMQEMLSNMSRAIIRFNRAKCRSRKVNLLERKLALIPICEHAHWYTQVYNLHVFPSGGQGGLEINWYIKRYWGRKLGHERFFNLFSNFFLGKTEHIKKIVVQKCNKR